LLLNRKFLGLVLLAGLSGCGFAPMYGGSADVAGPLDEISVANIPERNGQVLRLALENQLQVAGAPVKQLYTLNVTYGVGQADIGTQQDSSATRIRFSGAASWTLTPIGNPGVTLTKGQASTLDALNIVDQQYFAATLETNTVDQQMANEIAAQITTQLGAYFKAHPQAE
jgi:LPS-assembly lipoprotein